MKIKGLLVGLTSVALMGVFQQASAEEYLAAKSVVIKGCNIEDQGSGKHFLVINYEGYTSTQNKVKGYTRDLDIGVSTLNSNGDRVHFTKDISTEESEYKSARVFLGYSFENVGSNGEILEVQFYKNNGTPVATTGKSCKQLY